jgi:RecA/RadA recombinase
VANKWMQKLSKMNGVVTEKKDVFSKVIGSYSPSANYVYGRTHGLPYGYTEVLFGPPKEGKSVYSHMKIGWLHQTDPDAIAVKVDTEYRTDGQLDDAAMRTFGIDPDRLLVIQSNNPEDIFDQIEKDVAANCQAGAPVKLIVIDSISGVQGRREMTTESVTKQTIGDHAQTIQIGLKRILPIIRKYNIALILICQVRAEMDLTEQMRGNKFKMQAGFGLQHMAEYFTSVEKNKTAAGRKDLAGNALVNEAVKDFVDKGETVAMKIRVKMRDSSMGPKGRTGEFTFHFKNGVVSTYEEVFKLAIGLGIVDRPNNTVYEFGGERWNGAPKFQEALATRPELCDAIIAELKRRDLAGEFAQIDAAAAETVDDE